jgi:hypothetical protein
MLSIVVQTQGTQQDWSPEFVNEEFGYNFSEQFGSLKLMTGGNDVQQAVKNLQRRVLAMKDSYLVPDASNPTFALRPVGYQIISDGINIQKDLVDPRSINSSKLWGNPGNISSDGTPTPINHTLEDGSVVSLIIYFQRPFSF